MAFRMNHVHMKTPDPQKTAQFYIDNLGAKIVGEPSANGMRLDLHGLSLNITKIIEDQNREQKFGIEHIAIDTDDLDNVVASLKAGGARVLEELGAGTDHRICFFEGPEGVQLEVLEMSK